MHDATGKAHLMRTSIRTLAVTVVALALIAPTSAVAVEGLPDAIDDPIAAAEPEVQVAEPAAPAGDDIAAQAGVAEAAGVPDAVVDEEELPAPVAATNVAPSAPVVVGSGSLPFTGTDPGQLVLMLLVGSLLVSGGIVASLFGAARAERA